MSAPDLNGSIFADLRVIGRDRERIEGPARWIVACKCGSAPFSVIAGSLRRGITTRCKGCSLAGRIKASKDAAVRYDGKTVAEWAAEYGVSLDAMYKRLKVHGTVRGPDGAPPIDPKAWPFPRFDIDGVPTSPLWRRAVTRP